MRNIKHQCTIFGTLKIWCTKYGTPSKLVSIQLLLLILGLQTHRFRFTRDLLQAIRTDTFYVGANMYLNIHTTRYIQQQTTHVNHANKNDIKIQSAPPTIRMYL